MRALSWEQAAAQGDGRKGKVTCVRLTDAHRELLNKAARAHHERMKEENGGRGYYDGNRYRWVPMSAAEYMREAALLQAARELEAGNTKRAGGAGNTAPAGKKKLAAVRR